MLLTLKQWLATRWVALAWLMLACVLLAVDAKALHPARHLWFDLYQRLLPRVSGSQAVTIVAIDETTLAEIGQWPWPRTYVASLIDSIAKYQPKAIGLDILFPESDHTSPEALAISRPDLSDSVQQQLTGLISNDALLAQTIQGKPIVLGLAGFSFQSVTSRQGVQLKHTMELPNQAKQKLKTYPYVLASLPTLQSAAASQAMLIGDPENGMMRRLSLVANVNGETMPAMALELWRLAHSVKQLTPVVKRGNLRALQVGDLRIPVAANGEVWIYYDRDPSQHMVSARDVLAGQVPASQLQGKIVLVGLTGMGLMDWITTTVGDRRPGVDVHAQLLQAFSDGRFVTRPSVMSSYEAWALLLTGLGLVLAMPRLRPSVSLVIGGCLVLLTFGIGVTVFYRAGLLVDVLNMTFGLSGVFVSMLLQVLSDSQKQRKQMATLLQQEREVAAKVAGELESARRIQLNSLPDTDVVFVNETRFSIAAYLEPAREVGGDLYDCFMLDAQHLFVAVGDVSGKGVPASLFMAVTRALTKSLALRDTQGLDRVIQATNAELARDNPEMMFVTMVAAVLNVETGRMVVCNAGHEAPWRKSVLGEISRLDDDSGPPLCMLDDFPFTTQQYQLSHGDHVLLVSDGVTEAMNPQRQLYSAPKVTQLLTQLHHDTNVQQVKQALCDDIARHVNGAEPSDDITFLVLQWHGK